VYKALEKEQYGCGEAAGNQDCYTAINIGEVVVREAPKECRGVHDSDDIKGHVFGNGQFEGVALDEEVRYVYASDHESIC
jgi:hypothetical protein